MIRITCEDGTELVTKSVTVANKFLLTLSGQHFTVTHNDNLGLHYSASDRQLVTVSQMHTNHILNAIKAKLRGVAPEAVPLVLELIERLSTK